MSTKNSKAKTPDQVLVKADDVVFQASADGDGLIRLVVPGPIALKVKRDGTKLQVSFEGGGLSVTGGGKGGRLRLNARTFDDAKVVLHGQRLDLEVQAGQVVATRRGEAKP